MILLQESELFFGQTDNGRTDGRTEGRTEGQTDVEVKIVTQILHISNLYIVIEDWFQFSLHKRRILSDGSKVHFTN